MPEELSSHILSDEKAVGLRVILLTPGSFDKGSIPGKKAGQLLYGDDSLSVRLLACCVGRPETVSGWDFARRQPKPTERLAPAGSVYWLELKGDPETRLKWAKRIWMNNVSDSEQARRDGFGLAALGVTK
jgi:CRISPR-associated protein Cmr3